MEITHEKYVERLIQISQKKLKLLQDMLLLTMAQAESINEDGVEALGKLISDKQEKIEEINRIDEEFGVYFYRFKKELKVKSLDELDLDNTAIKGARELKEVISEIMKLIKEISEFENRNNAKAKGLLKTFSDELVKLRQGKKITQVYNPAPTIPPPSYFIDKKK